MFSLISLAGGRQKEEAVTGESRPDTESRKSDKGEEGRRGGGGQGGDKKEERRAQAGGAQATLRLYFFFRLFTLRRELAFYCVVPRRAAGFSGELDCKGRHDEI